MDRKLTTKARTQLVATYSQAERRLFFLDYDGTLIGFFPDPQSASPDERLVEIIDRLSADHKNEVVIISGRDKQTLTRWLGNLDVNLVAEHGAFLRHRGSGWMVRETLPTTWKDMIQPVMDRYVDRTPGSFVEEKSYSLVWHCRRCDPEQVDVLAARQDVPVVAGLEPERDVAAGLAALSDLGLAIVQAATQSVQPCLRRPKSASSSA